MINIKHIDALLMNQSVEYVQDRVIRIGNAQQVNQSVPTAKAHTEPVIEAAQFTKDSGGN